MRDISESIYELLVELDDICRENEIEYCLEGSIARNAYFTNDIKTGVYEANISMDIDNIKKLYKVIEKFSKENRCFESVINTKKKRNFVIRYLNTNTFFLDLMHPNRSLNKGIRINIHLRTNRYDNPYLKEEKRLRIAWKCGANNIVTLRNNFCIIAKMKLKRMFLGELKVGKKVLQEWFTYNEKKIDYTNFEKYLAENGIDKNNMLTIMNEALAEKKTQTETFKMSELANYDEYSIIRREIPMFFVNGIEIPAFLYDEVTYVTIKGRNFPVPKHTELYLWFAMGVKHAFNLADKESENVIASELLSYKEIRKKYKKYFNKNRRLDKYLKREKVLRAIIRLPIRKMFDKFEDIFFNQRGQEPENRTVEL